MATGSKINSAKDDAAGLSISEKFGMSIRGLDMAHQNTQNGASFLNIADGALSGMGDDIQRIRSLAVQAANGVYSSDERAMLDAEAQQRKASIQQTIATTSFGDKKVFYDETASNLPTYDVDKLTEAQAIAKGYTVIKSAADFIAKIPQTGTATAGKTYILMGNIDMSSIAGYVAKTNFAGTLEGNGYTISNLTINQAGTQGLFGSVINAVIKNVSLNNFQISGTSSVAALAGTATNSSITNCSVTGSAISASNREAGGLVGVSNNIKISSCYFSGSATSATHSAGGIIGRDVNASIITKCSSTGAMNCLAGINAGGIIGTTNGVSVNISECTSSASVTGMVAGGLIGVLDKATSKVNDCYATGSVTQLAGGTWGNNAGGLLGRVYTPAGTLVVTNSFSTGAVTGPIAAGLGGFSGKTGELYQGDFWNTETSGKVTGVANTNQPGVTGLTTAQMSDKNIFLNAGYSEDKWDFTTTGTPKLAWQVQNELQLQIGADSNDSSKLTVDTTFRLGTFDIDLSTESGARAAIDKCDKLMSTLLNKRSYIGASLNRLSSILNSQRTTTENLSTSKSEITDTDFAKESANMLRAQILQKTTISLMKQMKKNQTDLILKLLTP